ncbi:tripartite tricarboxylate transporter substrate binding protein [Bordetella sputigena]|uniref:Bug family tripartite tricarboxylate transporter substrate binding protein n=1 Tax=Bordetella sputigena TaxID=1416810 RepID=UPI0039EEBD02
MKTPIRGLCAAFALAFVACAGAAGYPDKPIRLIVPYAAGGSTDSTARLIAKGLTERLGQPVVVENRAGAGGMIGQDLVAKAPADGYTLLFSAAGPLAVTPHAYAKMPYDPVRAFTPIKLVAKAPLVLVANPKLGFKSVQDLIDAAKKNPGKITYASFGTGSAGHLAGELFKSLTGVDMVHVPYKGSAPGLVDVVGGQVNVMFDVLVSALPQVQAGKLDALAITLGQRSELMPNVPTMQEAGVKDFEAGTWFGLLGPAGMPPDLVARLSRVTDQVLADAALRKELVAQGAEVAGGSADAFRAFFLSEYDKWGRVARAAGIKAG